MDLAPVTVNINCRYAARSRRISAAILYYAAWSKTYCSKLTANKDALEIIHLYFEHHLALLVIWHRYVHGARRSAIAPVTSFFERTGPASWGLTNLLDKTVVISQTTFSYAFPWMENLVFWFQSHWSLFLGGPIDNKSPLVQVMPWGGAGDKPLPGLMLIQIYDAMWRH